MKLTKTELRSQQHRLAQLQKYLPTLQLKKMLLQMEIHQAQELIQGSEKEFEAKKASVSAYASLFTLRGSAELFPAVKITEVRQNIENVAGLDLPVLDHVVFEPADYLLFDSPVWLYSAIAEMRSLLTLREKVRIAKERKKILEKELREVSIRVNLFEKILIPRAQSNIRKIKIFLGDQQLAAVCQAKVAKVKISAREEGDL
jgi:V/A-type H+-transporting ATPase subunit D